MQERLQNTSMERVEKIVLSDVQVSTHARIWTRRKSVRFLSQLPWASAKTDYHIVYASDDVNGTGPRYDEVAYSVDGRVRKGILQGLFERKPHRDGGSRNCLAIIRRLGIVAPWKEQEVGGRTRQPKTCLPVPR